MSTLADTLVTWTEFLRLPERPENGIRYELHDGEVILVPAPRPRHVKLQKHMEHLLEARVGGRGMIVVEFPYRPVLNLQYWVADLAYVPKPEWDELPPDDYPIYAPPLIIEVLSPSNTPLKLNRQRIVAMSAGTQEFWVVDPEKRTVHVTDLTGARAYAGGGIIPIPMFDGATLTLAETFAI
jgi:Uma2 family endonuclease